MLTKIRDYNESMRRIKSNKNVNIFSPEYAKIVGVKPRATPSANIRLGGVYK